jgi:hypothetical protein
MTIDDRPFIVIGEQRGPRNARTDPVSGIRYYTWQGHDYPSVTTVRHLAGVPRRLHEWTIGQVITRVIERAVFYASELSTGEADALEWVKSDLRAAAIDKRQARAALGTAIHQAIEGGLAVTAVGSDLAPRVRQHTGWRAESEVEVLGRELQVWNLTVGYAGSVDLLGRFPDGSIWVVDDKTGGDDWDEGLYPDQLLQLLPYLMAEFVGADDVIDERLTALLHRAKGVALLHLINKGWEFRSLEATPEAWRAFRGLLAYSTWLAAHPDIDSVTLGKRRGAA